MTTLSAYLRGPGMQRRLERYAGLVNSEILLQTYPDGGGYEASTGYHVLAAQMFLHSLVVQQCRAITVDPGFESRLGQMFQWISTLADTEWKLPHIGDCDNGRVELLCDDLMQPALPLFQRHSLRVGSLFRQGSRLLKLPAGRWGG